jgi:hypothetical protein
MRSIERHLICYSIHRSLHCVEKVHGGHSVTEAVENELAFLPSESGLEGRSSAQSHLKSLCRFGAILSVSRIEECITELFAEDTGKGTRKRKACF